MTLRERGRIVPLESAVRAFAAYTGQEFGDARTTLIELLQTARPIKREQEQGKDHWRRRSRTYDCDINAHVLQSGANVIVQYVSVRRNAKKRSERPNHGYPVR